MSKSRERHRYDVCLSFAGQNRRYVKNVADKLATAGIRVFYDEFEKANLWGRDLFSHLDDIYQNAARYCVVFLSKHYVQRLWTNHERKSAQARALKEHSEYILPVRFDDTLVPGIPDTIGYVDARETSESELSNLIVQKLGPRPRHEYFPPIPDRLYKNVKARSKRDREAIRTIALAFFNTLKRMNDAERRLLYTIFQYGCPVELPDNIHIDVDFLRRVSGVSIPKIIKTVSGIKSLGFEISIREEHHDGDEIGPPQTILVMEWHLMALDMGGNHTGMAEEMISCATDGYCEDCGREALRRLDFCQLATATVDSEPHGDGAHKEEDADAVEAM